MVFSTKPSVLPPMGEDRRHESRPVTCVSPHLPPSQVGNFTKTACQHREQPITLLLVNPFSLTGTSFGPIM